MVQLAQTLQMAGYILEVFRYYPAIVMSWGIDIESIRPWTETETRFGVEFNVHGFKHQGKVRIVYDDGSDTFSYYLIGETDSPVLTREDIFIDNLVPTWTPMWRKSKTIGNGFVRNMDFPKSLMGKVCSIRGCVQKIEFTPFLLPSGANILYP